MKHLSKQPPSSFSLPLMILPLLVMLVACSGTTDPDAGPQPGDISGKVFSSDTGEGIDGVLVTVHVRDSSDRETLTDLSGRFAFSSLNPGDYELSATLPRGFEETASSTKTVSVDGNVNVNLEGQPIRRKTVTVSPGKKDTLATASGAFLTVDATGETSNLEVSIEELDDSQMFESRSETKPVRFRIRPKGSAETGRMPASRLAQAASNGGSSIQVELWQKTSTDPNTSSFTFDVGSEDQPLLLFADAQTTTYRDPETGKEETVPLHTFEPPADADIEALMTTARANDDCLADGSELRTLDPLPDDTSGETAIILVHGLDFGKDDCSDFRDFDPVEHTFAPLLTKLRSNSTIDQKYRFFIYRYPTNAPVLAASDALWNAMDAKGIERPVILGHSMGGLVGRGLMQQYGDDAVAGLVTLGTPHEGSPMAELALDIEAVEDAARSIACNSNISAKLICSSEILEGGILPDTKGLRDLLPDSDLVLALTGDEADSRKVFTLAGQLESSDEVGDHEFETEVAYIAGSWYMEEIRGQRSDGMVPINSATPDWTALQTTLKGHDHTEMVQGEDPNTARPNSVQSHLVPLLSMLATCEQPPEKPERNDFNLSGSVARQDGRTVRVTLNAIIIDGEVITDLTADNFAVIENGCAREISEFSSENVGVDLVFIQDMSSSMDGAISGVRSSAISFAAELANQGLNISIGSVGYSGPGTIPSTPGSSSCEFLGPVQDLSDPVAFQDHVAKEWVAVGGCDIPENALEAIEYSHNSTSWRTGAARVYVDITDASHHTNETTCNSSGPCTDHSLSSIVSLVGKTSTIHAVAPSSEGARTAEGGLDPWILADRTGGDALGLPADGVVDLATIGISDAVGEAVTFTFESASPREAVHTLRIRANINGNIAELAPDLVSYSPLSSDLAQ